MTSTDWIIVLPLLFGVLWLLWSGRADSPRRRREQARYEAALERARGERANKPEFSGGVS